MNDLPIRLVVDDDLRRSRLTVFFRLLFTAPHFVWVTLWSIAASLAAVANGLVILVRGRSSEPLHSFLSAYVRYYTHVTSFLFLVANPFPGFAGTPGYPVDLVIDPPERRNRWTTLFRVVLSVPAVVLSAVLTAVLVVVGLLGSLASLLTGRMPRGLRDLGVFCIHYLAQTNAYVLLVTDSYPRARRLRPPAEREPPSFEAAI